MKVRRMQTLMIYCCNFKQGAQARQALYQFSELFLLNGIHLNRLWMESFFTTSQEATNLLNTIASNQNLAIENLDLGQNPSLASSDSVTALARLLKASVTLKSLGLDHCQLKATQLQKILKALERSPSALCIQKLYLKNNRCDTEASCSYLIRLIAMPGSQIESVHTNWTGIRLELVPGRSLAAISQKSGLPIVKLATSRT